MNDPYCLLLIPPPTLFFFRSVKKKKKKDLEGVTARHSRPKGAVVERNPDTGPRFVDVFNSVLSAEVLAETNPWGSTTTGIQVSGKKAAQEGCEAPEVQFPGSRDSLSVRAPDS